MGHSYGSIVPVSTPTRAAFSAPPPSKGPFIFCAQACCKAKRFAWINVAERLKKGYPVCASAKNFSLRSCIRPAGSSWCNHSDMQLTSWGTMVGVGAKAFWRGIRHWFCGLRVCIPFQRGAPGRGNHSGMLLRSRGTMSAWVQGHYGVLSATRRYGVASGIGLRARIRPAGSYW